MVISDSVFRALGLKIHARKKGVPAHWIAQDGKIFTEAVIKAKIGALLADLHGEAFEVIEEEGAA